MLNEKYLKAVKDLEAMIRIREIHLKRLQELHLDVNLEEVISDEIACLKLSKEMILNSDK